MGSAGGLGGGLGGGFPVGFRGGGGRGARLLWGARPFDLRAFRRFEQVVETGFVLPSGLGFIHRRGIGGRRVRLERGVKTRVEARIWVWRQRVVLRKEAWGQVAAILPPTAAIVCGAAPALAALRRVKEHEDDLSSEHIPA